MKELAIALLAILSCVYLAVHAKENPAQENEVSATTTQPTSTVTYLGNEGLLVQQGRTKILFDPFFHNSFGSYQLVPEKIRTALFNSTAPYDAITAIFISHAHADHFAADDVQRFLRQHPKTILVAPQQAIEQLDIDRKAFDAKRIIAIDLKYQGSPVHHRAPGLKFDAVRIPHAGWPQRAEVVNIVYRVQLEDQLTVVHMGDADPNDAHFKPLVAHWEQLQVDTAFPPYWFFTSRHGPMILSDRIKAKQNIGVHVPIKVPFDLYKSGEQYFDQPGQVLSLP